MQPQAKAGAVGGGALTARCRGEPQVEVIGRGGGEGLVEEALEREVEAAERVRVRVRVRRSGEGPSAVLTAAANAALRRGAAGNAAAKSRSSAGAAATAPRHRREMAEAATADRKGSLDTISPSTASGNASNGSLPPPPP